MVSRHITPDNKKKSKRRMTPKDWEVRGNFFYARKIKNSPRKNTSEEIKANNSSKEKFMEKIWDIRSWIPVFVSDLERVNRNKRGRPYLFPDSLIFWMVSLMNLQLNDFRSVAGVARTLLKPYGIQTPSYSRLQERSAMLAHDFSGTVGKELFGLYGNEILAIHSCDNIVERKRRVGIDSSGLSLSCPNKWRVEKWKEEPEDRGWLKLHALADLDTGEVIAYALTTQKVGDSPLFRSILTCAINKGHVFSSVYADGAYSGTENWVFMEPLIKHGCQFITSFRSDTIPKSHGSLARGRAASLWCEYTFDEWKAITGYGFRWKSECVFSDYKRIFEETITAFTVESKIIQVSARIEMFNIYKKIRAEVMKITGNGICLV